MCVVCRGVCVSVHNIHTHVHTHTYTSIVGTCWGPSWYWEYPPSVLQCIRWDRVSQWNSCITSMASLSGLLALGILSVPLEPRNRGELPFLLPFGMVSGNLNSSTQACAVYSPSHLLSITRMWVLQGLTSYLLYPWLYQQSYLIPSEFQEKFADRW